MNAPLNDIGALRRRLVLEAPVETADGAGGVTRGYAALTELWAQVTPVSASVDIAADGLGVAVHHSIVIRARAGISTRHRFREGPRIYRIVAVRESANRRFLEIDAEERGG